MEVTQIQGLTDESGRTKDVKARRRREFFANRV